MCYLITEEDNIKRSQRKYEKDKDIENIKVTLAPGTRTIKQYLFYIVSYIRLEYVYKKMTEMRLRLIVLK